MLNRFIAVCAGLAVLGTVAIISAKTGPKSVVIDKCKKKRAAVVFPHEKHAKKQKIACKTCHHKNKPGKPCSSCHAGKAKGKVPGCAEMSMKKNPFHILCVGCHRKMKGDAPRRCNKCHK